MKIDQELNKLYYSIGEVAAMFNVANSLIRYWESEFPQLKPQKNRRGDRKFTEKDIKVLEVIFTLVKENGYTIDGAKKALKEELKNQSKNLKMINKLEKIRISLEKLKDKL